MLLRIQTSVYVLLGKALTSVDCVSADIVMVMLNNVVKNANI